MKCAVCCGPLECRRQAIRRMNLYVAIGYALGLLTAAVYYGG